VPQDKEWDQVLESAERIVAAGCADPLVLFLRKCMRAELIHEDVLDGTADDKAWQAVVAHRDYP